MSLNLDIAKLVGPGRLPAPEPIFRVLREVDESDLALMAVVPAGSKAPGLKRISDRHHALARLLAAGTPEGEAALITNYDPSRVSQLKDDPAFQELLALYQKEENARFGSVLDQMASVSRDALGVLQERLEENPDRFSNNELTKIAAEMGDRGLSAEERKDLEDMPNVIELTAPDFHKGKEFDESQSEDPS